MKINEMNHSFANVEACSNFGGDHILILSSQDNLRFGKCKIKGINDQYWLVDLNEYRFNFRLKSNILLKELIDIELIANNKSLEIQHAYVTCEGVLCAKCNLDIGFNMLSSSFEVGPSRNVFLINSKYCKFEFIEIIESEYTEHQENLASLMLQAIKKLPTSINQTIEEITKDMSNLTSSLSTATEHFEKEAQNQKKLKSEEYRQTNNNKKKKKK